MAHSRRSAAAGFRSAYRRIADVRGSMSAPNEEDFDNAERIAEMGGFDGIEDYLNRVVREAIERDAEDLGGGC